MPKKDLPPNSLQLADANSMRAELAKTTSVDTSALVDKYADRALPFMEVFNAARLFAEDNNLKVPFLLFFKMSAIPNIMEAMVVPDHHVRMYRLSSELAKQSLER